MRLILLTGIICVLCLLALVRPRVGLYGYVWYTVMRPDILAYVTTANYFSSGLALCTLVGSLPYVIGRIDYIPRSRITMCLLLLLAMDGLSTATAVDSALAFTEFWPFLRSMLVLLLIPILIETRAHLITLFLTCAGSIGVLGAKFGLFGLIHSNVRYSQGYGNIMDNNFVALAFATGVPLCWYGSFLVPKGMFRVALWVAAFSSVIGVVLTYSRGGALAVAWALFLIAWRSKRRVFMIMLMLVVGLVPAVYIAGEVYLDRLSTIKAPTEEGSAAGRITLIKIGLEIWKDFPITGVGFGRTNQQLMMPKYYQRVIDDDNFSWKVLHNTYVQVLVDSGILGLLSFLLLLAVCVGTLRGSLRRLAGRDSAATAIPLALQTSVLAAFVGMTFLSAADTFWLLYVVLLTSAAWVNIERSEASTVAPVTARSINVARKTPVAHLANS